MRYGAILDRWDEYRLRFGVAMQPSVGGTVKVFNAAGTLVGLADVEIVKGKGAKAEFGADVAKRLVNGRTLRPHYDVYRDGRIVLSRLTISRGPS